ncbi:pentatricopeptide repeat-containing protein [Prunus yedoensis var. nudiflora]|uniref:Pentatricopeptide repeat-containing protein n=1 Tax=Prunus yedoensis var. nudiflora TaxID=2094558 RepID=A0A314ZAJ9_PRUYE|nr:pentatricopeptide repeat-containing protein [Prunus yedoensis var. nudiflora]
MRGSYRFRQLHSSSFCLRSLETQQPSNIKHQTGNPTCPNPIPSKKALTQKRRSMNKLSNASDSEIVKLNKDITTQMRNGRCEAALRVFNVMPRRSPVSYNAMISGYLANGKFDLAKDMFEKMPERDLVSWNVMLSGYVRNRDLGAAHALFERMPEKDVVSWNAMLSGYAQNGYVDEARKVFERMPDKNEISWNGLLAAYVQNGRIEDAHRLFESKANWEAVSWNCLMGGFVKQKRLVHARQLFDRMPVRDEVSWNTMITGYAQNGEMSEARRLFEESPIRDVFAWTSMLSGYVQNGMLDEGRRMFDEMPEKNSVSWNAMIAGYVQCKRMDMAMKLFEAMPFRNASSWNTILTGYAQSGDIDSARKIFDSMPRRDSISWAAIIAGYAQNGYSEEALCLFVEMKRDGERLTRSSFTCALSTCAEIAALELGKQLHGRMTKAGYETGCYVGNALLVMYCKCGSIEEAYDVFQGIAQKDVVSWNTMIYGCARHGFGSKALMVFESMKAAGIKPDDVTMSYWPRRQGHGIFLFNESGLRHNSKFKHYTCMIDLLGRAGRLEEAQNLMREMPFEPDAATWGALLGASRIHGNTELGEKAAQIIFEMEPDNAGMYVLLSNLYAASGRWGEVGKMRLKMKDKGVRKVPGYSWVEVQNKIHTFSVGDSIHPDKERYMPS